MEDLLVAAANATAATNVALEQHKRIEEGAAVAYLKKSSSKAFSTRTDRSDRPVGKATGAVELEADQSGQKEKKKHWMNRSAEPVGPTGRVFSQSFSSDRSAGVGQFHRVRILPWKSLLNRDRSDRPVEKKSKLLGVDRSGLGDRSL